MNIASNVERGARLRPDSVALAFEGSAYSYRLLNDLASRCANGLRALGAGRGHRVALMFPNVPEFVIAYLGIQKLGAIAVSVNPRLQPPEARFVLEDSGTSILITSPELLDSVPRAELPALQHILISGEPPAGCQGWERVLADGQPDAVAVEVARDDPAAIVYSSGTTGDPKGVTLSHGNVVSNMYAKNHHLGMRPEDRLLLSAPVSHCFGQNAIMNSGLNACATIILQRGPSIEHTLETLRRERVTMLFGVPTVYNLICSQGSTDDLRTVRYCFSAAAPLPVEVAARFEDRFGLVINEGYGLTETTPFASYNHDLQYRRGSIGAPIENVEMKVVDIDNGQDLPCGERGEIAIRGPNVMLGYWNRPEETAQVVRNGWLHTGDIGVADEDGYFYLVDRIKDMINVAGLKVSPVEVEAALYEHPAVAEAAVYGQPDSLTGERVSARVVLHPGAVATEADLVSACRRRVASFKLPTRIALVDSLPKNATGKVLKRELRAAAI